MNASCVFVRDHVRDWKYVKCLMSLFAESPEWSLDIAQAGEAVTFAVLAGELTVPSKTLKPQEVLNCIPWIHASTWT